MTYAARNAMARQVCGLPPSKTDLEWYARFSVEAEQNAIAADITNSRNKIERSDARALAEQIKTQHLGTTP